MKMEKINSDEKLKILKYLQERKDNLIKLGFKENDDEVKEIKKQIYSLKEWNDLNYVNYKDRS